MENKELNDFTVEVNTVMTYRPNTDALCEAIVCLDVIVQFSDCFLSQGSAVVSLICIQDHCGIQFICHTEKAGLHKRRVTLSKRGKRH